MKSIGLVFKKEEMIIVSLKQGVTDIYLEGYRILPFLDLKDEEKRNAVIHNLERFFKIYKGGRDNLFIALPRDMALVHFLTFPLAVEENLRATLGYELDRHTPFSFDDVYFDYHILDRIPESNLLHVMLITIKREPVDYYLALFKKLKIKPQGIELTTTALFNTFLTGREAETPAPESAQAPAHRPPAWRYVPYADKVIPQITRFIKQQPEGGHDPAPAVLVDYLDKTSYEMAIVADRSLYYSRTEACGDQAAADTGHYREIYARGLQGLIYLPESSNAGRQPVRFYLSGLEMGKDHLELLPEELKPSFSVLRNTPVRLDKFRDDNLAAFLPVLAAPLGLALKGLQQVSCDINFIPQPLRPKRKKSKRKILALAFAALILLAGTGFFVKSAVQMKVKLAVLNEELAELKKQVHIIEELQQEEERIEKFSSAIKSIRANDISKITILEELTKIIPEDSWLTDFNYKAEEKKVKLSGFAVSASKLVPLLEESPFFENVKFTSPITTDRRSSKERFRLEMTISTGAK